MDSPGYTLLLLLYYVIGHHQEPIECKLSSRDSATCLTDETRGYLISNDLIRLPSSAKRSWWQVDKEATNKKR